MSASKGQTPKRNNNNENEYSVNNICTYPPSKHQTTNNLMTKTINSNQNMI